MITPKQKQIYDFIVSYVQSNGMAPSLDEIAKHFSKFLSHPSSAHYHVKRLEEEGYIEKTSGRPRAIGIYDQKEVQSPMLKNMGLDSVRVPILGTANAGPAMSVAEEDISGYLKVSKSVVRKKDGVFALRVEGDSMNKAKIDGKNLKEGDFVLIDSEYQHPKDGDYVLSVIDGCANLKKFTRDKKTGEVALVSESTNPTHKPIHLSSEDDFMVNGKIIAVIKK